MTKVNTRKEIFVYTHWLEMIDPILMGRLYAKKFVAKKYFHSNIQMNG